MSDVDQVLDGPVTIATDAGGSIEVDTTSPGETTTVLTVDSELVDVTMGTSDQDVTLETVLDGTVIVEGGGGGGATGPQGPVGPPGTGASFVFVKLTPASTWVIDHELGGYPAVTVIDSSGKQVFGDVHFDDTNNVTITFGASFGGRAALVL